jgi:hypothetical protein
MLQTCHKRHPGALAIRAAHSCRQCRRAGHVSVSTTICAQMAVHTAPVTVGLPVLGRGSVFHNHSARGSRRDSPRVVTRFDRWWKLPRKKVQWPLACLVRPHAVATPSTETPSRTSLSHKSVSQAEDACGLRALRLLHSSHVLGTHVRWPPFRLRCLICTAVVPGPPNLH